MDEKTKNGHFVFSGTTASGRKGVLSSIWEMTLSERQNAATLLENTTVKPFVYCRYFFKCFFCSEQFSEIHALLNHTAMHDMPCYDKILQDLLPKGKRTIKIDISNLKCKICKESISDIDQIRKHLVKEHKKEFTQSGNGMVAYNLSLRNGQFSCHICSKMFQTFILLNRHMNVHFSNAVCEICGAGFMSHQRLIQHKEIHSPGGYPCRKCGKVYTTQSNLKYHIEKSHEGATKMRMLRCPHCPERFTEHFRKLKHLKEVHEITFTYECDVCNSKFSSRRALTTHTNKFHTQKTFCGICRKSFSCVTTLKKHMLAHSGQKDFTCGLCAKSYGQQKSLNRHMRMHINECNKLACCGNGFQNRNDFNLHVKEWHPNIFCNFPFN